MPLALSSPLQVTIRPLAEERAKPASFWEGELPSFSDMLDAVNPLQHIPVLSDVYREISGDGISAGASLAGGALFGGPLGFLGAVIGQVARAEFGGSLSTTLAAGDTGTNAGNTDEETPKSEPFISASRHNAYNAYVSVQRWLS